MVERHDFYERTIKDVNEIYEIQKDGWIYRGQRDKSKGLKTTLERACESYDFTLERARVIEDILLRDFRRKYHHYSYHIPSKDNSLEWLSVMQHYGAPTRLLDFTYSFYVAAYFALENVLGGDETDKSYVVWAVNGDWSVDESGKFFESSSKEYKYLNEPIEDEKDKEEAFESIFRKDPANVLACPQNPFRLNERLTIQKGIFMCPGNIVLPFENNLCTLPGWEKRENIEKIIIPHILRRKILDKLYDMNITRATLFPGLDGFAQSLKVSLPKRWDLRHILKKGEF